MVIFWKTTAGILIAAIMCIILDKQGKDFSLVLTVMVCVMAIVSASSYIQPVLDFIREMERVGGLQSDLLSVLLKAVGVGLGTEIAALICSDAGNQSLGKMTQILGTSAVVYLSIPVFSAFLDIMNQILEQA